MSQSLYINLLLITMLHFTCGERNICSTIKESQNIINMIVVIDFDFFYRSCRFRTQTFKLSLTSCSPSCASSTPRLFRIIGKLEAKKIIENIFQTIKLDNAIQLFVAIKGSFSDLFFWTSQSKGEFPRNYLINVTTCLFAHH